MAGLLHAGMVADLLVHIFFSRPKCYLSQRTTLHTGQYMYILGLSFFYHDSAAALILDGRIVAAAQEERFTRRKHDPALPLRAVDFCLSRAGITIQDVDLVVFYDKPLLKFERLLQTYFAYAPRGIASFMKAMPIWLKEKLWIPSLIADGLKYEGKILFTEHHESHAASAFYPSPFDEAAFLTVDGVGEWATTSYGVGTGNALRILGEQNFPHSLGLLYSAFTYFTGFKVNSAEYKVMGLAPYGTPRFVRTIFDHLVDLKKDGSFKLDMRYFDYCAGLTMTNERFAELFEGPPRKPESEVTQREMDLARSLQEVTEEIMLRMVHHVHQETGQSNLVLAGGVALNCVANGRILREGPFKRLWIQPAAGDAGGAVGAALHAWYAYLGNRREVDETSDAMSGAYLGPVYSDSEIEQVLKSANAVYRNLERNELLHTVAQLIASENVVGWFQGAMEFGPRALGSRSILGDARSPRMQSVMNQKIKFRESFRPFAPSVLRENAGNYFNLDRQSPYMLLVADVLPEHRVEISQRDRCAAGIAKAQVVRSQIPAVTHVDYSARIQTVEREANPLYYDLIKEFQGLTGCALIINTSFNVRGEPIVCHPTDAYRCFLQTEMDFLAIGNYLLDRREQPADAIQRSREGTFELD
jgi:carbamoyltransferase